MSNKSEQVYWWISVRTYRMSKWLDSNHPQLLLIAIFAWLGVWGLFLEGRGDVDTVRQIVRGMGPELAGIVIAAVTIETLAERRQETERKKILVSQLGSRYRDVTEMALIELRNRGWLYDGSLSESSLKGANLSEANLREANLSRANMWSTNLSKADLWNADLAGADLWKADMSGASLWATNLRDADISGANLSEAQNWDIEQIERAQDTEGTIMPDGVRLKAEGEGPKEAPTFEEWKKQYLTEHGGTVTDVRDFDIWRAEE